MKLFALLMVMAGLVSADAAVAKGKGRSSKAKQKFCNARGENCLSYEQIEALRKSLRDQDRSSRGRGYYYGY